MLEKLPESIGHALINQRAGMENVLYNQLYKARHILRMDLRSTAFAFNARLPTRFTADGEGLSPPLSWFEVPDSVASLALLVEDADSPTPHPLVHAIVVGLDRHSGSIAEGALASPNHSGVGVGTGPNSYLQRAWLPPDPPRGHGEHRYVFQIFGLDDAAVFAAPPGRSEFIDGVLEHAVAVGCLIGTYERADRAVTAVESREAATPAGTLDLQPGGT